MNTLILAAILLSLAGFILVILGVRGRRLNHDPVCRKCRYNLSGTTEVPDICPECGQSLQRRRAIRRGERRRRAWLVALSSFMLVVGLSGIGTSVYMTRIKSQPAQFKPEWWLLMELESDSRTTSEQSFAELHRRMLDDDLSEAARRELTEWVLADFEDLSLPWDPRWAEVMSDAAEIPGYGGPVLDRVGDFVDTLIEQQGDPDAEWHADLSRRVECLFIADIVTRPQIVTYIANAARLDQFIELPERVHARTPWPFRSVRQGARLGPDFRQTVAKLGVEPRVRRGHERVLINGEDQSHFYQGRSISGIEGRGSTSSSGPTFETVGTKKFEIEVWGELVFTEGLQIDSERSTDPDDPSVAARWTRTFEAVVEVVPDDVDVVELLDEPDLVQRVKEGLLERPTLDTVQRSFNPDLLLDKMDIESRMQQAHQPIRDWRTMSMFVEVGAYEFCHRIFAVDDDGRREFEVGAFQSRFGGARELVRLSWPVDSWVNERREINLVFRPDPRIAEQNGIYSMVGNIFRMENVLIASTPEDLGDPEDLRATLLDALTVKPRRMLLTERLTSLSFEVTIDPAMETWKLEGEIRIGDGAYPIKTFNLAPGGWRDDGTHTIYTTLPQYSVMERFDGELGTEATLVLWPPSEYELDFELTYGPFDITPFITDQRINPDDE